MFLSYPPAIIIDGQSKESKAAIVLWGVVAIESLYHRTPFFAATSCRRWGRDSNVGRDCSMTLSGVPREFAIARAAARLDRFARPGRRKALAIRSEISSAE